MKIVGAWSCAVTWESFFFRSTGPYRLWGLHPI